MWALKSRFFTFPPGLDVCKCVYVVYVVVYVVCVFVCLDTLLKKIAVCVCVCVCVCGCACERERECENLVNIQYKKESSGWKKKRRIGQTIF